MNRPSFTPDSRDGTRDGMPRWFVFTLLHAVVLQTGLQLLRVSASYRAIELGAGALAIGAIAGSFALLPTILSLTLGQIIDRRGELIPFRAGAVLFLIAASGFLVLGTSVPLLILWSATLGLGHLLSAAGEHSIIARCASDRRRNAYFGYYTVGISLGQVIGPLLVAVLAGHALLPDTRSIFIGGVLLSMLVIASTVVIPIPQIVREAPVTSIVQSLSKVARAPGYGIAVLSGLVIFCAIDLIAIYLPVLGTERQISAAVIGTLIAVRAATSIASRLFFDQLLTRFGRARLLTLCLCGSALSLGLTAFTSNIPLLFVEMAVAGVCLGVGAPMSLGWATEVAPTGLRGSAIALRLAGNRFGQTVVPLLAGLAAAGLGGGGVFIITAGALGAAAAATAWFFRRAPHQP